MKPKIIYEDKCLLVIDKPAGLVVHPNDRGEPKETVVSWVLEKELALKKLNWPDKNRIGIVHRLDKDTSGLLILAKTPEVLKKLQQQFQKRKIKKEYLALVLGKVEKGGTITSGISRHPKKEKQRTLTFSQDEQKESKTVYDILYLASLDINSKTRIDLTLLKVTPETGRMHQIRVHLKYEGLPILGDQTYFTKPSKRISKKMGITRQFLHAHKIEFTHPQTLKKMEFKSELPKELDKILKTLDN